MRQIKFRAWDKCNERMVEPRNILKICMSRLNQEPYLIVYLRKWMNENREIKESDKCYTNEFELMQYTGLKDKNGVEIYEGDIISFDSNISIVFYNSIHCAFMLDDGGTRGRGYLRLGQLSSLYIEVIGNIYENKELMEE